MMRPWAPPPAPIRTAGVARRHELVARRSSGARLGGDDPLWRRRDQSPGMDNSYGAPPFAAPQALTASRETYADDLRHEGHRQCGGRECRGRGLAALSIKGERNMLSAATSTIAEDRRPSIRSSAAMRATRTFRHIVDRYLADFERMLQDAKKADPKGPDDADAPHLGDRPDLSGARPCQRATVPLIWRKMRGSTADPGKRATRASASGRDVLKSMTASPSADRFSRILSKTVPGNTARVRGQHVPR